MARGCDCGGGGRTSVGAEAAWRGATAGSGRTQGLQPSRGNCARRCSVDWNLAKWSSARVDPERACLHGIFCSLHVAFVALTYQSRAVRPTWHVLVKSHSNVLWSFSKRICEKERENDGENDGAQNAPIPMKLSGHRIDDRLAHLGRVGAQGNARRSAVHAREGAWCSRCKSVCTTGQLTARHCSHQARASQPFDEASRSTGLHLFVTCLHRIICAPSCTNEHAAGLLRCRGRLGLADQNCTAKVNYVTRATMDGATSAMFCAERQVT